MKIEFISDVICPWCAIGLHSLERALESIGDQIEIELHIKPFELNPQMAPQGEDAAEHLARKYGLTPQQLAHGREVLRARGAAVGFEFGERKRIWNTFDAHRLLHWAGLEQLSPGRSEDSCPPRRGADAVRRERGPTCKGRALELKHALLRAYHGRGENVADPAVLLALANEVGLDAQRARAVLESERHADDVRRSERRWERLGIHAVPSLLIDGAHLVQGGHPPEVFEQALRQLADAPG